MSNIGYTWLGSTGLKVSQICLGTMTFGEHAAGRPSCTEAESHAILDRFTQLGGNFIDTADVYQWGKSEEIIGTWLEKKQRDKYIIATKVGRMMETDNPNSVGCTRLNIMKSIDQSLKRLRTDYVDIYYLHIWDNATPIEETLSAMNDLVRVGKVRYVAFSNAKGWQLQKIVEVCKQRHFEPVVCLQQQYSLLCRSPEWETGEVCVNEGIGLLPWSPLKGGWLSGRMQRGQGPPGDTRVAWASGDKSRATHSHPDHVWFAENDHVWRVLDKVHEIAKARGKSVPQISLRWLLQKPAVPSVVIGVRTLQQLEDNMAAASGWELSSEEMKSLDEVSTIPWPYPYDYLKKDNELMGRVRP